jgi:hypothetical protein
MKKITAYFVSLLLVLANLQFAAVGQAKSELLIKNATVLTAVRGTLENTEFSSVAGRS